MSKITVSNLEFYITNVCNLTCKNCRSFNNYKFSGFYEFDKAAMSAWAEKIDLPVFSILGGEPTLHPRLHEWIKGLAELWPNSERALITNGTYLSKVPNLHTLLADYKYNIQISTHGYHLRELIAKEIFLTFGDCQLLSAGPAGNIANKFYFLTSKGVVIDLQNGNMFQEICFTDDQFTLRKNDPEKAHEVCNHKCHHMIDNKIYKCSVAGLLPEFLRQQKKDISHLPTYHGMDINSVSEESVTQMQKKAIPYCGICSVNPELVSVDSRLKKDRKLIRIVNSNPV